MAKARQSRIGLLRLLALGLLGPGAKGPREAVGAALALQAQELASGKWSLGARVRGSTEAQIDAAFARGELLRSWVPRGTLHLVAPADLPWLVSLLGQRVLDSMAGRRKALSIELPLLSKVRAIAEEALGGGRALSREALLARFVAAGCPGDSHRGYHLLASLCLQGVLCLGPLVEGEQAFVLLAEQVPRPRKLPREEGLRELCTRYFEGHGPASLADLVGWSKLTAKEAREGLALSGRLLEQREVDGVKLIAAAGGFDQPLPEGAEESALALPGFDEFVLGFKERGAVLDPAFFERVVPGGNGMFRATLVLGGRVAGTWSRESRAKERLVRLEPFRKLTASERSAAQRAVEAWGRFVGAKVRLA
jgi:Winged helix DNA-binding domain